MKYIIALSQFVTKTCNPPPENSQMYTDPQQQISTNVCLLLCVGSGRQNVVDMLSDIPSKLLVNLLVELSCFLEV